MKFLCKEFWTTVYKKEIDQLKTDYQGTFLILDHRFRGLGSFMGAAAITKEQLQPYLQFPCGVLRGALAALGVEATVSAEANWVDGVPRCAFRICVAPDPTKAKPASTVSPTVGAALGATADTVTSPMPPVGTPTL